MGFTVGQMEQLFERYGEQKYRGRQLFKWLYNDRLTDFVNMTNFTRELRGRLADDYAIKRLELKDRQVSVDGTEKFLFLTDDGHPVETVLIPDDDRNTLCVSSQAGCPLACRFCATGTLGLRRDLTAGEIIGQMMYIREFLGDEAFTNVVFMGMGEPLLNYDNLLASLQIMTDSMGLGIGAKKIVISTCGISPKIRQLADDGVKARLAISLHAATQAQREEIMPVARSYDLDSLIEAIRYYTDRTRTRVMFEYILMEGFNDSDEDIKALSRLMRGLPCKINLLAYNPVPGLDYRRPDDERVEWFAKELYPRAPAVMVRKSRGRDIDAACGQLAGRNMT